MKKEYIKPEIVMEVFATDSMLALSTENMGSNETPGTDDDFNSGVHRGEWGSLWKNGK
jgi:hypothetical protein